MYIPLILPFVTLLGCNMALGAGFRVRPFTINISSSRMEALVNNTILPARPEYPGLGNTFGIDLDALKSLQNTWTSKYSWAAEQSKFNQ